MSAVTRSGPTIGYKVVNVSPGLEGPGQLMLDAIAPVLPAAGDLESRRRGSSENGQSREVGVSDEALSWVSGGVT